MKLSAWLHSIVTHVPKKSKNALRKMSDGWIIPLFPCKYWTYAAQLMMGIWDHFGDSEIQNPRPSKIWICGR